MGNTVSDEFHMIKDELAKREKELEDSSLEMAVGLSEVFEALKKISSGDPFVKLDEKSNLDLIVKLKKLVNNTSSNLAEMVNLLHEFAIGLAEHFDVLHRVSSGDLGARVLGNSKVELLESLKNMTNHMIESVANEIAHRKKVEAELRESEERFRTFAEKAPIGITIMGPDRKFEYINPTFTEIFGYNFKDIPDKDTWFVKAYPDPEYRRKLVKTWETYMDDKKSFGEVKPKIYKVRCKNGKDKIIHFRTVVLESGKHFVTYSDITDKALAEEAIRASEERYRILLRNIQDGVFIVQDDKIIFANEALIKMVGYEDNDIPGRKFEDFIAPEDKYIISHMNTRKEKAHEYEVRLIHKDKKTRIYTNINLAFMKYNGKIAFIGTIKNITEKRRIEKEKKELEDRLRRSKQMEAIGTLAGGVAHDLNNILSGVVSYPELLLMDLPHESPMRKPIMTIKKSGERAAAIVQDLLTLARRGVATKQIVNLNNIVKEYLASPEYCNLRRFYPEIEIITSLEQHLLNVTGSPVHLSKTLMNLVSNAAEAIEERGIIEIKTETRHMGKPMDGFENIKPGDYVCLIVSDNGAGISGEDIERIFEPFYTKKVMGRSGTGLGMAVVWGTVKDHHGYIDVRSMEKNGSVFTLYFPVTREELPEINHKSILDSLMGHGESILIVDDIKEQRELASIILEKLGYVVKAVSSGEKAVEYIKNNKADLIILDMIMEHGMDGLDTYRQILKVNPFQKAIIVSGFSETDRIREAQSLGAGGYVKKPYTLDKIGLAVKYELEKKS